MNKIFMVTENTYCDCTAFINRGVFDTKEKAEAFIQADVDSSPHVYYEDFVIEEWEVK